MEPQRAGTRRQRGGHPGQTQPDPYHSLARGRALATDAQLGHPARQGLRPKRTAVVSHYTEPPEGSTTVCAVELEPVVPRTFDPAPGCAPTDNLIKPPPHY